MTNRWTTLSQRMVASEPIRNEDISRRAGPLRYWFLLPAGYFLVYASIFWCLLVALSSLTRLVRILDPRRVFALDPRH